MSPLLPCPRLGAKLGLSHLWVKDESQLPTGTFKSRGMAMAITMAKRFGLQGAHERCLTCPEKDKCGFYLDLKSNASLKALYLDNEKHDGYFRDRCVWGDDIDIEDTLSVTVRYRGGAQLAYSLIAHGA